MRNGVIDVFCSIPKPLIATSTGHKFPIEGSGRFVFLYEEKSVLYPFICEHHKLNALRGATEVLISSD